MSISSDRVAQLREWRLELALCLAAVIGVIGLADQILIVAHADALKLAASGLCCAGLPAAIRNFLGGKE